MPPGSPKVVGFLQSSVTLTAGIVNDDWRGDNALLNRVVSLRTCVEEHDRAAAPIRPIAFALNEPLITSVLTVLFWKLRFAKIVEESVLVKVPQWHVSGPLQDW